MVSNQRATDSVGRLVGQKITVSILKAMVYEAIT